MPSMAEGAWGTPPMPTMIANSLNFTNNLDVGRGIRLFISCLSLKQCRQLIFHQLLPLGKHQVPSVKHWPPLVKHQLHLVIISFYPLQFLTSAGNFCQSISRSRSFDRITFFRNSSVVLSKFVSKEKFRSFEYRRRLNVLSKVVLSKFQRTKFERKKMNFFSSISTLVRLGQVRLGQVR